MSTNLSNVRWCARINQFGKHFVCYTVNYHFTLAIFNYEPSNHIASSPIKASNIMNLFYCRFCDFQLHPLEQKSHFCCE